VKSRRKFAKIGNERTETESMEILLGKIERHHESDVEFSQNSQEQLPKPKIWREVEFRVNST
jgi:hypothetical protein